MSRTFTYHSVFDDAYQKLNGSFSDVGMKKLKIYCSILYSYQVINQILRNIYIYIYNCESMPKPIYGTQLRSIGTSILFGNDKIVMVSYVGYISKLKHDKNISHEDVFTNLCDVIILISQQSYPSQQNKIRLLCIFLVH